MNRYPPLTFAGWESGTPGDFAERSDEAPGGFPSLASTDPFKGTAGASLAYPVPSSGIPGISAPLGFGRPPIGNTGVSSSFANLSNNTMNVSASWTFAEPLSGNTGGSLPTIAQPSNHTTDGPSPTTAQTSNEMPVTSLPMGPPSGLTANQPRKRPGIDPLGFVPLYDVDPELPFAPAIARSWGPFSPFSPERSNRVLRVPGRHLAALGLLYPFATFVVSRHPASKNHTQRMSGLAIAKSVALHFPHLNGPNPAVRPEDDDDGAYIVALRVRDVPRGAVATFLHNQDALDFLEEVRNAFDEIPRVEAWFKTAFTGTLRDGSKHGCLRVWRAWQPREEAAQPAEVVRGWMRKNMGVVLQDAEGAALLKFMGEAWVEPDKYPKPTKAQREARERQQAGQAQQAQQAQRATRAKRRRVEEDDDEDYEE
ncbi:hypothetical protein VTK56DRAFT_3010 [Thermocarpiscus australiensis]